MLVPSAVETFEPFYRDPWHASRKEQNLLKLLLVQGNHDFPEPFDHLVFFVVFSTVESVFPPIIQVQILASTDQKV